MHGLQLCLHSAAQTYYVIASSTAAWVLHVSPHARDIPEELLSGKKILLFLLEGLLYCQYRDSGNLGSLNKASDNNASFFHNGANFAAYLCFTTKNPAVIITR